MNPYDVVKQLEQELCEYTGAPYAVTTTSCTMALRLALMWHNRLGERNGWPLRCPSRTYISVPMAIIHAGFKPKFYDFEWSGAYELSPLPVVDSARRFTSDMYELGEFQCVSFHTSKICGDTQGGAILHDDEDADGWFRRMRFDGRTEGIHPKDDTFNCIAEHCYMSPDVAARLLLKLSVLPAHNEDLPNDDYPDLSKMEIFK